MLQIRLLGQFDARMDGKRITIPTRAAQSLLAYLVLTAGTPHRREKLAGIFWPETSDENARKNLRQELWRIRKAISAQGSSEKDYFLADELTLTFNRDGDYWLDVAQIERPDTDLQSLTTNLALYQGELLPGFYEEWISIERERVQAIFEARIAQLLEQLITNERWVAVEEWAERWLALSGAREPAYRALMLASGARGDIAKVASLYQRCTDELLEQLGVEPSAETRALYDGLVKGARAPRAAIQPSGTITFLFTDIEGSTRLLEKLGEQYAVALSQHHEILRAAIRKWNGHEVDTQGDAFFVTFARALDAVQCAAEAQRALATHPWQPGAQLRVRMGLHTGETLIASTGYVGMDVHRAARIGDVGHGGQVLLSQTTRDLVLHDLPAGLSIRDLGEHRLKDMKYPTPIYQVVIDGLPAEFPALKTKFTGLEAPTPGDPPFKGLEYFDEADADLFFGRELLTAKLVQRLRETRFLSVVVGASGSGKSSLVRAGLLPALKKGDPLLDGTKPPKDSTRWHIHIMTPTAHPLETLATELTRDAESVTATATLLDDLMREPRSLSLFLTRKYPKGHTLLVMDQFEELFTLCRDAFEREAFIDNLLSAVNSESSHVSLIITLRADFYAHLSQYPELRELVARHQEYIGPMTPEELRRAIEEPARRGYWDFEPGLVDLILRDVGDEPGALPLLSHALLETWKRRAGHILTLKGYADAGGVHGAIAHTAESVYQDLSEEEQVIASNIFLRLTELGEGTEDTRRRASFDELMSQEGDASTIRNVLNILADARLVTLSEDTAEVAHEALIREWPTLREWLNQDREGLRMHRHLTEAAREWELLGRDPGALYRGAHLAQAREWAALNPNALNVGERSFLNASLEQEQHEQREREEQQQRELEAAQKLAETERARAEEQARSATNLRKRSFYLSVALVIAIVSIGVAVWFTIQSRQQASIARASELSALALAEQDKHFNLALLFGLEGFNRFENARTRRTLLTVADSHGSLENFLVGHTAPVSNVVLSPDSKLLASGSWDNTIILWDVSDPATPSQLAVLSEHRDHVNIVAFSPDGKLLASGSRDSLIILWDVSDPTAPSQLTRFSGNTGPVYSIAFSPDGKQLASGGEGVSIILWDVSNPEVPSQLATLSGHSNVVTSVAFSPDGKHLTSGSWDNSIILWDISDPGAPSQLATLAGHVSIVYSVAFSPDGKHLASGGDGNSIILWDVSDPTAPSQLTTLVGSGAEVSSVAFSPDGKRLASGSLDGSIILWDVSVPATRSQLAKHSGPATDVSSLVLSPNGKRLASGGLDGSIILWDVSVLAAPSQIATLTGHTNQVTSVAFSPDSQLLASGSWDNSIILWDISDPGAPSQLATLVGHDSWVFSVAFSPDGKLLASGSTGSPIILWDVSDPTAPSQITTLSGHRDFVYSVAFSPDGKRLASGSLDGSIILWDVSDPAAPSQFTTLSELTGGFFRVTFSPDGKRLASGSLDGSIILWDVSIPAAPSHLTTLSGHSGGVTSVTFSWDGKRLASGSADNTIILWDISDPGAPSQIIPLLGHSSPVVGVAFNTDGTQLVSGSVDNFILWGVDTQKWIQNACQRVGRNFTYSEWVQYFPTEEYRKTCEQWPKHWSFYQALADEMLSNTDDSSRVQKTFDKLRTEMELDSAIKNPRQESSKMGQKIVTEKINFTIDTANFQEALELIGQAEKLQLSMGSIDLNSLCWYGSIAGYAVQVIQYCEQAVDMDPMAASIRDSRGLARALTEDYQGAIEDFQFAVDEGPNQGWLEEDILQRQQWIVELKAGRNPFTSELLEELMGQ